MFIFFSYKVSQTLQSLTLTKPYMRTKKKRREYTFVHSAILLTRQVFGACTLPVTISFEVEALSFRLGSSFGLLHGSGSLLAILLEFPFLSLALLLETSSFINHQHLMLFAISTFIDFSITKSSGNVFVIPCIL